MSEFVDDRILFSHVIDLIGRDAALDLCVKFGGIPIWIPLRVTPGCQLAQAIGVEKAKILSDRYGGNRINSVPIEPLKMKIAKQMRQDGKTIAVISRHLFMSVSGVYAMLRKKDYFD